MPIGHQWSNSTKNTLIGWKQLIVLLARVGVYDSAICDTYHQTRLSVSSLPLFLQYKRLDIVPCYSWSFHHYPVLLAWFQIKNLHIFVIPIIAHQMLIRHHNSLIALVQAFYSTIRIPSYQTPSCLQYCTLFLCFKHFHHHKTLR